jgi:PIN domain nuclease of toxin-antitoxin system
MRLLLDTHLVLWSAFVSEKVPEGAVHLLAEPANQPFFSVISLWEVAVKAALQKPDFNVDPAILRQGLLDAGYEELPVTGHHALAVRGLPALHKDPFDRLLIAQAIAEGITLLTSDAAVARYPGPIRRV